MSKRDSLTGSTAVSERAARRGKPVKVSKPFPWGTVAGGTVLALVLVGILGSPSSTRAAATSTR